MWNVGRDTMNQAVSQERNRPSGSIVLITLTHGLLPAAWLVFAYFVAPRIVEALQEMEAPLAPAGRILIQAGGVGERGGVLIQGILAAALLADVLIYRALARSARPEPATVWFLGIALLEIVVTIVLFAAVYLALLTVLTPGL